jgi:hypothetical protein
MESSVRHRQNLSKAATSGLPRPSSPGYRIMNARAIGAFHRLRRRMGWLDSVRDALQAIRKTPSSRVIIYGEHSPDWMSALAPDAPVWRKVVGVEEALSVRDSAEMDIAEPSRTGLRTVVIPLMEDHARHCPRQYLSLIPDERSIDVLANKAAFAAYAEAEGLSHLCPKTYASSADAVFPCVLKRLDLNAGQGVEVANSPEELQSLLQREPWRGRPFILQSLTAGSVEYVTHCVCKNGLIVWRCSFAYEMDATASVRRADNIKRISPVTASRSNMSQIERFLRPLAYSGPCNVDYKISDAGDIVVMEINPRLGGSLMKPQNIDYLSGALSSIIENAE